MLHLTCEFTKAITLYLVEGGTGRVVPPIALSLHEVSEEALGGVTMVAAANVVIFIFHRRDKLLRLIERLLHRVVFYEGREELGIEDESADLGNLISGVDANHGWSWLKNVNKHLSEPL